MKDFIYGFESHYRPNQRADIYIIDPPDDVDEDGGGGGKNRNPVPIIISSYIILSYIINYFFLPYFWKRFGFHPSAGQKGFQYITSPLSLLAELVFYSALLLDEGLKWIGKNLF